MAPTRRQFLGGGVAALSLGLAGQRISSVFGAPRSCVATGALTLDKTNPLISLSTPLDSVLVDGMPFQKWFTGDKFPNDDIPFHFITDYFNGGPPPEPTETVRVAVVGGGLSGLTTAYLLREHGPVVFELHDRFGGNAKGEVWQGVPYSLGSAYVITPDKDSFLEGLYRELGLDRVVRTSYPPDPVELYGKIRNDFWEGGGLPAEEADAIARYAQVVADMAENSYPEIPLPEDPKEIDWIKSLDQKNFRQDLEQRMEMSLTPFLKAGVQGYFYSSFNAAMEEISAASGWNFVAAEEFGRWVFPGGNAFMVWELWRRLRRLEDGIPEECRPHHLRGKCRVIDVRPLGDFVQITYFDSHRRMRAVRAEHVVMACSKHVCKHVLHDLSSWDDEKLQAMNSIGTFPYMVVNVLLDSPILLDFYDCFLVGDETFPIDPNAFQENPRVTDMIRGDFADPPHASKGVLTLYFPLPWPSARFTLLLNDPWESYSQSLVPQIRHMLGLLGIPDTAIRQVRMTRWGHAMPIAAPNLIANGIVQRASAPLGDNIRFVNQDNWALPAVENSLLDAQRVAVEIAARL